MARKIERKAAAAEAPSAADSVAVLSPDVTLTLAGRRVTVREYGFFEGLEVAHQCAAFIADMTCLSGDGELKYARIRRLFGVHHADVVWAAARSADVEPEWVEGLESDDAEVFMSTWFGVNSAFFVHEVVVELREARSAEALAARSTGSTPSPTSPPLASETSTGSAASPSVN